MKKMILSVLLLVGIITTKVIAQDLKEKDVPTAVKVAFAKKYPEAKKVSWEKEKGNFEANWGGKSGEDNSVVFTPAADFVEIVVAIPINQIPAGIAPYVAKHYNNAKIKEA
ncbi:MAG: PepSY-like domain-containing protein, partial [Bacteroidota bacterium]|nr:PepSY-like domain-containing protein [Bacteroidota bacterium]